MKNKGRTCSVDGCTKAATCRLLCVAHYRRLQRYGDPEHVPAKKMGEGERFLGSIKPTDECIRWPLSTYQRSGYGQMGGKNASRRSLIIHTGHDPGRKVHAAHSCHNRWCVNPRHLRWATAAENLADRVADGTAPKGEQNPAAKLTPEIVLEARRRAANGETHRSIAADYGVSRTAISDAIGSRTWGHLV